MWKELGGVAKIKACFECYCRPSDTLLRPAYESASCAAGDLDWHASQVVTSQ